MRHVRPNTARPPLYAIAALCLALLGLALPRFSGPVDPGSVFATGVAAGRAGHAAKGPSAGDSARFAAPVASAVDESAVLQRATEAMARPQIELGWSKARALPAHARHDARRCLVAGDPVRVAEREVAAHASPILRWRLAHSTSSGIG